MLKSFIILAALPFILGMSMPKMLKGDNFDYGPITKCSDDSVNTFFYYYFSDVPVSDKKYFIPVDNGEYAAYEIFETSLNYKSDAEWWTSKRVCNDSDCGDWEANKLLESEFFKILTPGQKIETIDSYTFTMGNSTAEKSETKVWSLNEKGETINCISLKIDRTASKVPVPDTKAANNKIKSSLFSIF